MGEQTLRALPLASPVPAEFGDELARRVYFVSPRIVGFELVESDGMISAIRLSLDGPADVGALGRKLDDLIATEVLGQRRPRPAEVWRSRRRDRPAHPAFDALVRSGAATEVGPGRVALGEPMLGLVDRLDGLLSELAVREFGAVPMRYPTLLSTDALARCGYLTSFPQHAMFATRLDAEFDVYRDFVATVRSGQPLARAVLQRCSTVQNCLPPTMCYHTFDQFAGRTLDGPTAVTARGAAFRFEGRYAADLERLWDFTIREIVFLGDAGYASAHRTRFLRRATELLDSLDLAGHCEVANDPFFGNAGVPAAISAQLLHALKYEAHLAVAADRTVAVGSFNLHGRLFTEAFGISLADGRPAASACVGFGLERLAYAVVCQHGIDEAGWPAALRVGRQA